MMQICGVLIALPRMLLFETTLKEKKFPDIWEKANLVPVHKKKNLSISLLLFLAKYFKG